MWVVVSGKNATSRVPSSPFSKLKKIVAIDAVFQRPVKLARSMNPHPRIEYAVANFERRQTVIDKKNRTYRELKKIAKYYHVILSLGRVKLKMSRRPTPKTNPTTMLSTGIKANPLRLRVGCFG
ncbi:hypothetical protein TNCV_3728591 [Trichonephila clavipes]|nr:hypothetical protein TNCV_3728591 [Trichonephila clavipes]